MADFTLAQLSYFREVARDDNMTSAAVRAGVAQSTLSTAVQHLERVLDTALFVRKPNRGLVLTDNGRVLLAHANRVLESAQTLEDIAEGLATRVAGPLELGVFGPVGPFRLPSIMQRFTARHPDVDVRVREGDLQALQDALLEGACEIALMYTLGMGPGFHVEVVDTIAPHVLVPATHRLAAGQGPVDLRDFQAEPFIALDLPHSREYYEEIFAMSGVTPNRQYSFSGYETVRAFVGQGLGYSVLNQVIHSHTYAGLQVAELPLPASLPGIDVALVWPEGVTLTRRAQEFVNVCRRVYREFRAVSYS